MISFLSKEARAESECEACSGYFVVNECTTSFPRTCPSIGPWAPMFCLHRQFGRSKNLYIDWHIARQCDREML